MERQVYLEWQTKLALKATAGKVIPLYDAPIVSRDSGSTGGGFQLFFAKCHRTGGALVRCEGSHVISAAVKTIPPVKLPISSHLDASIITMYDSYNRAIEAFTAR